MLSIKYFVFRAHRSCHFSVLLRCEQYVVYMYFNLRISNVSFVKFANNMKQ